MGRCLLAFALLVLSGCAREEPRQAPRLAGAAPQDTGFAGTTAPIRQARPGVPPRLVRAVDVTTHPGYDRVVFEFNGDSVPGFYVEYASRPVVRCGSGDPVSLAGTAPLNVRLEPASAHDERGNSTLRAREWTPGLPAVKEMKLVCDFEGQVEWVLGVAAAVPYRVSELAAPPRLVLDVAHRP